jgi:hypothetical protein
MTTEQKPHVALLQALASVAMAHGVGGESDAAALALAMWMVDPLQAEGRICAQVRLLRGDDGSRSMRCLQFFYEQNPGFAHMFWNLHGWFQYKNDVLVHGGFPLEGDSDVIVHVAPRNMAAFLKEVGAPEFNKELFVELVNIGAEKRPNSRDVLERLKARANAPADLSEAPFKDPAFLLALLDGAGTPEIRKTVIENEVSNHTAMRQAVSHDRDDLMAELLVHGRPLDADDPLYSSYGERLIHMVGASPVVARRLLDLGVSSRARTVQGATPLHFAAHPDVSRLLLARGAHLDDEDDEGRIALHRVLEHSLYGRVIDPRCLTLLLDAGADPFYLSKNPSLDYLSPFQAAVKKGCWTHVRTIAERCPVDFGQRTLKGKTLLQLAGSDEPMKVLLRSLRIASGVRELIGPHKPQQDGDSGVGLASRVGVASI